MKKWFRFCQTAIPLNAGGVRFGHDEYTHYYYSQALYILGDDGWEKLFGRTPENERLTWSKYRELMFDRLLAMQSADGSWPSGGGFSVGPVYSSEVAADTCADASAPAPGSRSTASRVRPASGLMRSYVSGVTTTPPAIGSLS